MLSVFGKGWTRKTLGQSIGYILRPCTLQRLTRPSRTSSRKKCTRVSTCHVRSLLAGLSLIIIQEALSSHISVAPTCRKLKPHTNARKLTASWPACDAATNSASALLRVTPPCRGTGANAGNVDGQASASTSGGGAHARTVEEPASAATFSSGANARIAVQMRTRTAVSV